jgi:hypothetical protein
MSYTRDEALVLVTTILNTTASYSAVYNGVPDTVEGQSPVAMVYGQGYRLVQLTRTLTEMPFEIAVIIAVAREANGGTDADQAVSDLVREAMLAFHAAGFTNIRSDAGNSIPQRIIDGVPYRVERIVMSMEDS